MEPPPASPPADPKPRRSRSGSEKRKTLPPFPLRLLPEERAAIAGAAEQAGLTMGSYIRRCVLAAPLTRARTVPSVEVMAVIKLQKELNKIGGNIYQLTRHVNFGNVIDTHGEIAAAFAGFREATLALTALRKGLEQPQAQEESTPEPEALP